MALEVVQRAFAGTLDSVDYAVRELTTLLKTPDTPPLRQRILCAITGGGPRHDHPWEDEAYAAVHGGLWRTPYAPRSALGLAALLGFGSARG